MSSVCAFLSCDIDQIVLLIMEEDKKEILKKLMEMKKELTKKQKKLDKCKRTASVKAHVRQKIKEQESLLSSTVIQPSLSSKDLLQQRHSDVPAVYCIKEFFDVQEKVESKMFEDKKVANDCTQKIRNIPHNAGDNLWLKDEKLSPHVGESGSPMEICQTRTVTQEKHTVTDTSDLLTQNSYSIIFGVDRKTGFDPSTSQHISSDIKKVSELYVTKCSADDRCNHGLVDKNKNVDPDQTVPATDLTLAIKSKLAEKIMSNDYISSNLKTPAQSVLAKRSREDSSGDLNDFVQDCKAQKMLRSRSNSRNAGVHHPTSRISGTYCQSVSGDEMCMLTNVTTYKVLTPCLDKKNLSEERTSSVPRTQRITSLQSKQDGKRRSSDVICEKSANMNLPKSSILVTHSVYDPGIELKDNTNKVLDKAFSFCNSIKDEHTISNIQCESSINGLEMIDISQNFEERKDINVIAEILNKHTFLKPPEHSLENNNFMSNNSGCLDNGHSNDALSDCHLSSTPLVPNTGYTSNTDSEQESLNQSTVLKPVNSAPLIGKVNTFCKYTPDSVRSFDKSNENRQEGSMSSDEDIIKVSQTTSSALRSHFFGPRSISLAALHSKNIFPPTPSFRSITSPLNIKDITETIVQEPVTDSEFLCILGLTQNDGEMALQKRNQGVHVPASKTYMSNTNLALSMEDEDDCKKSQINNKCPQNLTNAAALSARTTPVSSCPRVSEGFKHSNNTLLNGNLFENNSTLPSDKNYLQAVSDIKVSSDENVFSDYTELDAIPYSQFELTEDFLSESQQSRTSGSQRAKSCGSLVKRRSARLSSFNFKHPSSHSSADSRSSSKSTHNSSSQSTSICSSDTTTGRKRSLASTKKVAAVLSVFQFLIDEARKTSSVIDFELPPAFSPLKESKSEFFFTPSCFFEVCEITEKERIESKEEYTSNKNNVLLLGEWKVDKKSSSSNEKGMKRKQDVTVDQADCDRTINHTLKGHGDGGLNTHVVHDSTSALQTKENVSERKQQLVDEEVCCKDPRDDTNVLVRELFLDCSNRNNNFISSGKDIENSESCEDGNLADKPVSFLQMKNPTFSKINMKRNLLNQSKGKTVAKNLFAAKNASISAKVHGINYELCPESHSVENSTLLRRPDLLDDSVSGKCSFQILKADPIGWTDLSQNKTPSPRSRISTIYETPQLINMSNQSPHLCKDSLLLTTPNNLQNIKESVHVSCTPCDLESPQLNVPVLQSQGSFTPALEINNSVNTPQSSRSFSLTSTPKTAEAYRMSSLDFNLSFNDCETSKDESQSCQQHILQSKPVVSPSKPASVAVLKNPTLSPDESYLSPAQIPKNASNLLLKDFNTIWKAAGDFSYTSSVSEKSVYQNEESRLSNTFTSNLITPWKKLPKTSSTPIVVLENDDCKASLGTPVFSPIIRRSRTKASTNRSAGHKVLRFSGCFQCCSQDAVVSLLSGVLTTKDNQQKYFIVSVQATSLTVWTEDDVNGWTAELDWRLSQDIHVMNACLLPRTDSLIAVVASGWDKKQIFVSVFAYDWSTEDTARFNIPLQEQENVIRSVTQIELCPFSEVGTHIALTSNTHHTVCSVICTNSLTDIKSLSMFGVHRGKLISFVAVEGQASANVSLTLDQELSVWNMKIGVVLRKIKLHSSLPCLTGFLAASYCKGLMLLDTVWRVDEGDCGGVIALNPLTGKMLKVVTFSVPNNTWRSVEVAKSEKTLVMAISDKGSLGLWDRRTGSLLGYTGSKITTCATMLAKNLIVGEIHGCLHIYSAQN